jgi:hypothetical protein
MNFEFLHNRTLTLHNPSGMKPQIESSAYIHTVCMLTAFHTKPYQSKLCWALFKELTPITRPAEAGIYKGPNGVVYLSRHLNTEIYPVSETLRFMIFRISDG